MYARCQRDEARAPSGDERRCGLDPTGSPAAGIGQRATSGSRRRYVRKRSSSQSTRPAPGSSGSGAGARFADQALGVGAVAEAVGLRPLLLEILVDLEEVLDLRAQLRLDVVDVV